MIGFLHPWVLLGLPVVGVPILLHLIARREPPTVEFPAVRYLVQVTQEHSRRLRLRHLLLLAVRTLLILLLVLGAAGPTAQLRQTGAHAPTALAIVFDNSPSSGAVIRGTTRLLELRAEARRVLGAATPSDGLWLITAAGEAERGSPPELLAVLDSLTVSSRRMDLGEAVSLGQTLVRSDPRPGGVVVLSDLQRSAFSAADLTVPLVVVRPDQPPPANASISRLAPGPQPWTPEGGTVAIDVTGDSGHAIPVSVQLADRPPRQALVTPGTSAVLRLPGTLPGWALVRATKDPDELRGDDQRISVLRVVPVAAASWSPTDRFVDAAAKALEDGGRVRPGGGVTLGRLGPGSSVIWPPSDRATLGALNRELERRGVAWSFTDLITTPARTDSGPLVGRVSVLQRYGLRARPASGGGAATILATVGGAPWVARSGDVVLLASRLEPEWTGLPLSAAFPAFLDQLVNRVVRGEVVLADAAPGDPVRVPEQADGVAGGSRRWEIEGGGTFRPPEAGAYFFLAGTDTIGAVTVNPDPREADLAQEGDGAIRALWRQARLVAPKSAAEAAFASTGRASLEGPLLWGALLLGAAEVLLASGGRRRR